MPNKPIFPKNFLWGASTASHQVEGGTRNQWSVWELEHAQELAKTARRRLDWLPDWKEIKPLAEDPNNYVSGRGVDHYRRYEEDFDIAKELNLNSFRFGLEWSRLQPSKDAWDAAAIAHYRDYIKELRARGIEPIMNLWHWTMPVWFDAMGGFEKRSNLKYWEKFVERVAKEFGQDITYIITLNEPNVFASFGYLTGEWPPQKKNVLSFLNVYWNLSVAHRRAYKILKRHKKSFRVGVAAQLANIQAKRPHNQLDILATHWMRYFWNWWFLNRVKRHQDFVGFNYYFTDYYKGFQRISPRVPTNDLGWYMEPEGLYPLIIRVWSRYKKPIIITENGVADAKDQYRQWWIEESIIALERAISEGAQVHGYLHWSLLDNFEWKYGWWPKFGLVEVDREHGMKRTIRPSGYWFARKIEELKNAK
jgi:beta-glucosidase